MIFQIRHAFVAIALITFALLIVFAIAGTDRAGAARYVVAQCGWRVGHDANWYDLSANRFERSSYCRTPRSVPALEGAHVASRVRRATRAVGGTRYAAWRWQAPRGTGIVNVHGQRWHRLRNGFRHLLGGVVGRGGFTPFLSYSNSDTTKRDFWRGFSPFAQAFESRLICYRPSGRICKADGAVLSGLRALTISIDDSVRPSASVGGELTGPGWLRGVQSLTYSNRDTGAGLRFAETTIDSAVRARTEMGCAKALIAGQWRGTRMQPCPVTATGRQGVDTARLADGPHRLVHCATDFAGNDGCSAIQTIRVDNNPPAAPLGLTVEGGTGWHRSNGFNLTWTEPDQGAAAPIFASLHRLSDADGDSRALRAKLEPGRITGVQVPGPGEYRVRVWLVDQAGNASERQAAEAMLKLDDRPPSGYFADPPEVDPALIRVPVSDRHSGVAGGSIAWRWAAGDEWRSIPSRFSTSDGAALLARVPPEGSRGERVLRAAIVDRAGNLTVTDRRANGSQMVVRSPIKDETRITARLNGRTGSGKAAIRVRYGRQVGLRGRLAGPGGRGVRGAMLTVVETRFPGSRRRSSIRRVRTGRNGHFRVRLAPGPGRRVEVEFGGNRRLAPSSSGSLRMTVGARLAFRTRPRSLRTGQRVVFRGRVAAGGARHPVNGNLIQIQYFEESARRWRPVTLTRTDRRGRFRAGYRFRYITGVARIRLRATLVPSSRFPYGRAASRPIVIRVRGH